MKKLLGITENLVKIWQKFWKNGEKYVKIDREYRKQIVEIYWKLDKKLTKMGKMCIKLIENQENYVEKWVKMHQKLLKIVENRV